MPLELVVVTPVSEALTLTVDEVVVPGAMGELGLLPGHIPLISALRPGVLSYSKDGRRTLSVVSSGFVEIESDKVTILTDSFEPVGQIDVERAKKALTAAEDRIKNLGPDDAGYIEARRRAERAQARIDGAARA